VGKNTEESLQNDLALFNALQEGRQAEMEKKSAEFQEETRKAEAKPLNATQAVIEWVNNTRRYATRLDDEADALLAQLTLAAADES
ncbi:type III secretion system translocon subunit SctE, partial [Salmonella enterica subsp. enterica serovar Anatum]|nr:type III secretion system translocon subunit SctE [Salmonella enterica subsp. enterica serovar Anatum]